ncbi:transglutaminase-like domain-containing protein [Erythrobacter crassostreae]|uniref:Transglutaminase family protein n=1 Tax=Erythrobacter crassostreae TaxID=2828328 RepID=A0A9X1F2V5_9SPHN|nr:transglutaminase family protein [Erythrobacter crassostrea]MBV7259154.1 transglutaminase family protein [Erythrobacter crassostrea]
MPFNISVSFACEVDQPTDVLLQFEAAALDEQAILSTDTRLSTAGRMARIPAQDSIGERIWVHVEGRFEVQYTASVELHRKVESLAELSALPFHQLPGTAVQYLLDSRYCAAEKFHDFAETEFAGTSGGIRVQAIRDWIEQNISYVPGASGPNTGAGDTFIARQGICRDYAHVLVTLARASGIPARYVACFSPGVNPPDFHAVAEVFLADPDCEGGGSWQLVDGTGMARPDNTTKIGVGRDAADVSFLTSFGPSQFEYSSVLVSEIP